VTVFSVKLHSQSDSWLSETGIGLVGYFLKYMTPGGRLQESRCCDSGE